MATKGALKLAALIRATYGTSDIGITRPCSDGGQSEHKEGRALDWMLSVRNPAQKAKAEAFLAWLLATDQYGNKAAMATRLGVMYIGWDNQMWRGYQIDDGWGDLKGCTENAALLAPAYDTTCHRNHIHISLTWDGAAGLTSFWDGTPQAPFCQAVLRSGAATPAPGTQVFATPSARIVDSRKTTAGLAACRLSGPRWSGDLQEMVVKLTGRDGVPATGVSAVEAKVYLRSANTGLSLRSRPTASSASKVLLTGAPGSTNGTATIPVSSNGTARLSVTNGSADVVLDVVGYRTTANAAGGGTPVVTPAPPVAAVQPALPLPAGAVHALTPALLADTGTASRRLKPGETRTYRVTGKGGIPTSGVTGVLTTVSTSRARGTGSVRVGGTTLPSTRTALYSKGMVRVGTAEVATTGVITVRNDGKRAVRVRVVAVGWTGGSGTASTWVATPSVVVNTASAVGISGRLTAGRPYRIDVSGASSGVPAGAKAVWLRIGASGAATPAVVASGGAPLLSVKPRLVPTDVVLVPISSARTFVLTSNASIALNAAVVGWVR